MNRNIFKIYKEAFICDCCGESTIMGLIGYSTQYPKICDLCLINGEEDANDAFMPPAKSSSMSWSSSSSSATAQNNEEV